MKRFFLAAMAGIALMTGCSYDDSELKGKVGTLETSVAEIQRKLNALNSSVTGLQTAYDAMKDGDYITGIQEVSKEGLSGYTIKFAKHEAITIYYGKNGNDASAPVIGVKEEDGVAYWTVNGSFLLNADGQKIRLTGQAPMVKVEDSKWKVSYDGGASWVDSGSAVITAGSGIALFTSVEVGDEEVVFNLADGGSFRIPLAKVFALVIENTSGIGLMAGQTTSIPYSITNPTDATTVDCIASGEYEATVVKTDSGSGMIKVTPPNPFKNGKVLVYADNGAGKASLKTLTFEDGVLKVVAPTEAVVGTGGTFEVKVTSNILYKVQIPAEATWIKHVETRAVATKTIVFSAEKNLTGAIRTVEIKIVDMEGAVVQTVNVAQAAAKELPSDNPGDATILPGGDF